jgi:tRNA (cytidine32/uridine32-2'-O)-methyltransferase
MRNGSRHSWLDNVAVVLVEPEHPGNIAATARVMAVNGVRGLRLVQPTADSIYDATPRWLAWGAEDILDQAARYDDLPTAVNDAIYVIGTTRRKRKRRLTALSPKEAAETLRSEAAGGPVAIVFGPERTGLHGTHLEICHAVTAIPQRTDHPSLNLSHAVAIYAYELTLLTVLPPPTLQRNAASTASLRALRHRLISVLEELGPAPERLAKDLFRVWMRARPTEGELRLLHRLLQRISSRLTPEAGEYKCTHPRTSAAGSIDQDSSSHDLGA